MPPLKSSRPGPKRTVNIRARIGTAIAEAVPELSEESLTNAVDLVVDALTAPEVLNQLAEVMHEALLSSAHYLYEFEGDRGHFWDSRDCAEVAVSTVRDLVREEERPTTSPADAAKVHAVVSRIAYKDWQFDVVRVGQRLAVRVAAAVPNVARPDSAFETSRKAVIFDDVLEAAFRAIMQLEEHEARERFIVADDRPLNPHSGGSSMPPAQVVVERVRRAVDPGTDVVDRVDDS